MPYLIIFQACVQQYRFLHLLVIELSADVFLAR